MAGFKKVVTILMRNPIVRPIAPKTPLITLPILANILLNIVNTVPVSLSVVLNPNNGPNAVEIASPMVVKTSPIGSRI